MFQRTLLQALWLLLVCVSGTQGYEDEIEVNYADTFYNEISEGESLERKSNVCVCVSPT